MKRQGLKRLLMQLSLMRLIFQLQLNLTWTLIFLQKLTQIN